MEEKILDDFGIKEEITLSKSEKYTESLFIFLAAIIFGFGYIMFLINGYYHFKIFEFTQIGRQDLIARLGFITFVLSQLLYPTSIIIIGVAIWIFSKKKKKGLFRKLSFSLLGLVFPGFILYEGSEMDILIAPKEKWIIGIALISISLLILSRKIKKI